MLQTELVLWMGFVVVVVVVVVVAAAAAAAVAAAAVGGFGAENGCIFECVSCYSSMCGVSPCWKSLLVLNYMYIRFETWWKR